LDLVAADLSDQVGNHTGRRHDLERFGGGWHFSRILATEKGEAANANQQ